MSDKKTPLNTIRESLHGALLKCAQYAQNPARDPQEVDYALCVLVPEEIEEALAALRSMEGSEPVGPYTIQRHPDGDRWQVIGPHGFTSQWKSYELAKILRDEQNAAHPPAPAVVESKRPTVEQVMEVVVNWLERSGDEIGFSHTMKDLRSRLTKLLGDGE